MAEASLRELLASFTVEVDKAGELDKGNAAVDALKAKLAALQASFDGVTAKARTASQAVSGFGATPGLAKALEQVGRNRAASLFGNFGAAQGLDRAEAPDGPQFGPTRGTLQAFQSSWRGRLQSALAPLKGAAADFGAGFKESSGLKGAIQGVATLRNGLLALGGGFALHALTGLVDKIGDIGEASTRLGVTVEDFQRLNVLAEQNGTSVGALGTAFRTLAANSVNPTKESTAAMAALHVQTKNADGTFKSRNDLFFETAGALADVSDGTKRAALAQQLYGRRAIELAPLLANGRAALEKQRKELEELPVLTEDLIANADELSDSWKTLGLRFLAAAGPVLKDVVIPALRLGTEWLFKIAKGLAAFAKEINPLRGTLTAVGVGLGIMGVKAAAAAGGWAKLLGSMSKAALQFGLILAAFLLIEDVVGFAQGDDSLTGRLAMKLFGPEGAEHIRQGVLSILEAVKQLFNYLTGGEVDQGAIAEHLGKALGVKPEGPRTAEQAAAAGEKTFASAADLPWYVRAVAAITGGLPDPNRHNNDTIPLPAGQYGPPQVAQPNNVTVGDRTVIVNGVDPNNAPAVAKAVDGALGRDRQAIMAPYVTGGPI